MSHTAFTDLSTVRRLLFQLKPNKGWNIDFSGFPAVFQRVLGTNHAGTKIVDENDIEGCHESNVSYCNEFDVEIENTYTYEFHQHTLPFESIPDRDEWEQCRKSMSGEKGIQFKDSEVIFTDTREEYDGYDDEEEGFEYEGDGVEEKDINMKINVDFGSKVEKKFPAILKKYKKKIMNYKNILKKIKKSGMTPGYDWYEFVLGYPKEENISDAVKAIFKASDIHLFPC